MSAEQPSLFTGVSVHEVYRISKSASKLKNLQLIKNIFTLINGKDISKEEALINSFSANQFVFDAVSLIDVLINVPPEIWVVIDHDVTDTSLAEQHSYILQEVIHSQFGDKIKVSMHSGGIDEDRFMNCHVMLLALSNCFMVMKARGTNKAGTVIPYESLR